VSIETFTDLQNQIKELSARDPSAIMPTLTVLVETQVNRRLRMQYMLVREKLESGTAAGQYLYSWPTDALSIENIEIEANGKRYPLQLVSAEGLDQLYGLKSGAPEAYGMRGRYFELRPCPAASYPLRVGYYQKIPPLTSQDPSNWLLSHHPDIYLYGCLTYQAMHIRDMEGVRAWSELFGNALVEAADSDALDDWSGSTPQMVSV
jgi:hypothetical protein